MAGTYDGARERPGPGSYLRPSGEACANLNVVVELFSLEGTAHTRHRQAEEGEYL